MSDENCPRCQRLSALVDELRQDLRAMRIGREDDDLKWRKLWEKEKARADRLEKST
jgi:hypothetical protein